MRRVCLVFAICSAGCFSPTLPEGFFAPADPESEAGDEIYANDFDGNVQTADGVVAALTGPAVVESVQGYSAYGFSGAFLHNADVDSLSTTFEFSNLPPHETMTFSALLAAIDSWDGAGSPNGPDTFTITLDGTLIFSSVLHNTQASGVQTYAPRAGGLLVREQNLGFNVFDADYFDSGYDLGREPTLKEIPHTASTAVISITASGPQWQGADNESFALDNVRVIINEGTP